MGRYRYSKHKYWVKPTSARIWILYRIKYAYYQIKKKITSFISFISKVISVSIFALFIVMIGLAFIMPQDDPKVNIPEIKAVSPDNVLNIAGADGHRIILANNVSARDPTYEELKTFLKADRTDEIRYNYSSFVCADFAETVHNNAEKAGIKAGYVSVDFYEIDDGHACNVFNTTDRGLIFIDCTGYRENYFGNCDTIVTMKIGEKYDVKGLFGSKKYYSDYNNGDLTVKNYEIDW